MNRIMTGLARFMALLGGIVLTVLILMICLSVLGRGINTFLHGAMGQAVFGEFAKTLLSTGVGPILGDFELVEAGIAFAIFAFIPFCQITGGHATVDIFTAPLGPRVNRVIAVVVDSMFAAVLILIAAQLYGGMLGKIRYNETTFLIQFPIWWAYAAALSAAVLAAIVAVYMAMVRIVEAASGRVILDTAGGADH